MWYWGYRYPEETNRGLSDREDLYTPGELTVTLQPGETGWIKEADLTSLALPTSTVSPAKQGKCAAVEG